ncbi:uncharacterized protein LOC144094649 [Amblyomma americanum]
MAVRRRSVDAAVPAWLRQWLLLGTALQSMAAAAAARSPTNFGTAAYGILLYRGVDGTMSPYCCFLSSRFRLPRHNEQEEVFRGIEFRYANQSCKLDLEKAAAKHVFLVLPERDKACSFEDSLAQAVSAKTFSIIVARSSDLKLHKNYFQVGENGMVPVQDVTVGVLGISTLQTFKPDYDRAFLTPAANTSSPEGEAAKLYVVEAQETIGWWLIWIMACATVSLGALWSGSTRQLLLITQHRRTKPKEEQPRNEDADLDAAPVARATRSSTSLGLETTTSQPVAAPKPKSNEPANARSRVRSRAHNYADDFPSSDNIFNEEMTFSECPVDCKLVSLFVLMLAVDLLVLYYFFNRMRVFLIGGMTLGSVISLIVIFDSLSFLIPCASMRMPNMVFPCFVRSMEVRHHIVIWCAVTIPLTWVTFRKAHHAWILQNILGSSFAVNILRCVQLPNFKIITLLSVLLFFYDIFMVFVTSILSKDVSVMESVAKGVEDLPVLMRVPLFFSGDAIACSASALILGYGDIAVPGMAVAYCHSYDSIVKRRPWYFLLAIACYGAGLVLTFHIGHMMDRGQPALLYLVPAVLIPVILLAWCRGDLRNFWNGEFVPKEGLLSPRLDVCVSSSEQFQMMRSRGLLYVSTPVIPWLAIPLPVSQKAYNTKWN